MELKGIQKIYHSEFVSNANDGLSGLKSLESEYNSAKSNISQATSVQDSLANNPFDPHGLDKKKSASTAIIVAQHVMAHTSAIAPNYQNQYTAWSAKDQRYLASLNGSGMGSKVGSELANYGQATSSDVKNMGHYGLNNHGMGQSKSEDNSALDHYRM